MNEKWGKDNFGGHLRIQTEVVNGVCPTCHNEAVLVSLFKGHYRCITCGSETEQKINGAISFMPIIPAGGKHEMIRIFDEDGS